MLLWNSQEIVNNHIVFRFLRNPSRDPLPVFTRRILWDISELRLHIFSVDIDITTTMCLYSRMLSLVHNFKCFTSPQLCRDLPDPLLISIINFQCYNSSMVDIFSGFIIWHSERKIVENYFIAGRNRISFMNLRKASRHIQASA